MTWNKSVVTGAIGLVIAVKVGSEIIKDITNLNSDSSKKNKPNWKL